VNDLIAFLNARMDEDEAAAKAAPGRTWRSFTEDDVAGASVYDEQWVLLYPERYDNDDKLSSRPAATGPQYIERARDELAAHIARHDPARVLHEVRAKRAILARHAPGGNSGTDCLWCSEDNAGYRWPCPDVRSLAAVYSEHSDYRHEWE
jgi:hypothetical protein